MRVAAFFDTIGAPVLEKMAEDRDLWIRIILRSFDEPFVILDFELSMKPLILVLLRSAPQNRDC